MEDLSYFQKVQPQYLEFLSSFLYFLLRMFVIMFEDGISNYWIYTGIFSICADVFILVGLGLHY